MRSSSNHDSCGSLINHSSPPQSFGSALSVVGILLLIILGTMSGYRGYRRTDLFSREETGKLDSIVCHRQSPKQRDWSIN
jgi:hypothetical protein